MPSIANNAEAGLASGTTVTAANSGGTAGTAPTTVTEGVGNSFTFNGTAAYKGTLGYSLNFGVTEGGTLSWAIASTTRTVLRFYVKIPDLPTAQEYLGNFRNSTGNMATIGITSTGKLSLQNASGAGISGSAAAASFPVNEWVRVELAVTPGTTTTDGRIEYAYYLGDSTTAIGTYDTGATVDTGTTAVARARLGRITAGTQARVLLYDDMSAADVATGWLGPSPAPVMAANAGPNQADLESLTTVTLAGSGSTDGVYAWRQVSGPTVTLSSTTVQNPTFQSPATVDGASLVFGLTVDATPSAEDTVSVSVRPHQVWARPGGVWRPVISYA